MGIYFFYGDEDFLIDAELQKFKDKLDENFSGMNYRVYDKLAFPDLISVLRTTPMMFGKIMIIINCLDILSISPEDNQIDEISAALKNNNEAVDIFFIAKYPRDDKKKKPDTRRKIFKLLSKYNKQEFPVIPSYKTSELSGIIKGMAKKKGVTIENSAVAALIENIGNNLREFDIELDKLQLISYPRNVITDEMVYEFGISNQDLFNLTDYITKGEKGKALSELRKLLAKKHPLELLAPIQTILKKHIYLKLNIKTMSLSELGHKTGMHEYAVKKALEKMRNIKTAELVRLRENLAKAEYKIKSGSAYNIAEELENAVIG